MAIQDLFEQYLGDDLDKANEAGAQLLRIFRSKALRKGISHADAEDLATEMCCELSRMKEKLLIPKEDCSKYVFGKKHGIWHNLCYDWFQRASRRPEVSQTPERQDELGKDGADRQSFRACLDAYRTEDGRQTLRLMLESIRAKTEGWLQQGIDAICINSWEGRSFEELARAWNVPPATLRSRVLRAYPYLRHQVGNE